MRCVIVGYGYWGKIIERYVRESADFTLVGICSPRLSGAPTLRELVEDGGIAAAIVCTPTDTHFEIVSYLLENGIHVFCEKPLCKQLSQTKELYARAREHGVTLFADYIYTVSPSVCAMRDAVRDREELGAPLYVRMEIAQFGRFYKTDDVFAVLGVHMLSVLGHVFDVSCGEVRILETKALRRNENGLAEAGWARFSMPKLSGEISCSLLAHEKQRRVELYCERGLVVFDMLGEKTMLAICHRKTEEGYEEKVLCEYCFDEGNNLSRALSRFAEDIRKGESSSESVAVLVADCLEQIGYGMDEEMI
ncbi:MAG: Gfo/Idh/MocA family oxidoreductase [Clostridiales bacterium]|nr:Gfo/Idh/MocA family oxidoreductase [Clostridiales bacterium]